MRLNFGKETETSGFFSLNLRVEPRIFLLETAMLHEFVHFLDYLQYTVLNTSEPRVRYALIIKERTDNARKNINVNSKKNKIRLA